MASMHLFACLDDLVTFGEMIAWLRDLVDTVERLCASMAMTEEANNNKNNICFMIIPLS